jgi:hypothetical protein
MNLREAYRLFGEDSEAGSLARQLLGQQHWYASIAEFDPRTGEALPLGFDTVLHCLANGDETTNIRDRLWRVVEHSRAAVERIFDSLSENPRREQAILPIRDVKELNATSFIALSRRPGRNVREKLAGKPYMQAVRRYQSVDLPQNRLLKEFVTRLAGLLEMRKKYVGHEDVLLGDIHRWLRSHEAQAISRWDNLPPNNTLLSHRDYRRVWDAWRWLQALDDEIDRDFNHLSARAATVEKWKGYAKAYSEGKTLFGDMPVLFDYDTFTIEPWREPVLRATAFVNRPDSNRPAVAAPACVDLTYLRPRYATVGSGGTSSLPEAFLWQRWTSGHDSVDLELYDADIALLQADATSVSCADLFFERDADAALMDWAAHAFTRKLSKTFANPVLVWLTPDFLNDFQLQVARRNINARYSEAEPLPRSVAAVFEQIDYSTIKRAGFQVVAVDSVGGTTYATKLIARHDLDLQDRVPETRGFYWERSPHVTLHHDASAYDALAEVPRIDGIGRWHDRAPVVGLQRVSAEALHRHPQIGEFDICITLAESPVRGGIELHELQVRAGHIPLWRDHIPELSIKVIKDGRYQPFFLVDRETTIRPVRGLPVSISVSELFTLPSGRTFYQFPLFQGQDPDDLGYVARLESPAFPLPEDVTCRLVMTYTYGADDPYRLLFEPLNGAFKPVQVKWQPKTDEVVTDAPAPEYPTQVPWEELQRHYNAGRREETDLLQWALRSTEDLLGRLSLLGRAIDEGTIKANWKVDRKGKHFTFASRVRGDDVFVHENDFVGGLSYEDFSHGDALFFVVAERGGQVSGRYIAGTRDAAESARTTAADIAPFIRRALYVPYIRTWSDGRSLRDAECPEQFRNRMSTLLPKLENALHSATTPGPVKSEIKFLLSCVHEDMPASVSAELAADATRGSIDEKSLGFALGELSQDWQRDILDSLMLRRDPQALRVLARALWRSESLVRAFRASELAEVADLTLTAIRGANKNGLNKRHELASPTRYCELLLGLLRSRASDDQDVRMQLQPHQAITKALAEQIERSAALIARSSVRLESRVEVANLPDKPEGESTPDLLYALRLYLTGDVGADAIRVTGVNDGEDD